MRRYILDKDNDYLYSNWKVNANGCVVNRGIYGERNDTNPIV